MRRAARLGPAAAFALALVVVPARSGRSAAPAPAPVGQAAAVAAVAVDEHVGARVPLDLPFTEASGRRVTLGQVTLGKPTVLVLAYVRCSMLCSLVLRGVARAVAGLALEPGRDYHLVTVSIDPREEASAAAARRDQLVASVGRPIAAGAWTYLVGAEGPIQKLAASLGFGYAWDARSEQFAHPAVIFVLTPDGRIADYLHGIEFPAAELGASLAVAGQGEVVRSTVADAVLRCFRFDPAHRLYRERIELYLRVGAGAVMAALGSLVGALFLWERRRRRRP